MLSLGFTSVARRTAVVAGAVALVSAAACSDETTAPRPSAASLPTSAQGFLNPVYPVTVSVQVKNSTGTPIWELARVKFTAGGKDTTIVKDNDPADKNAMAGVIAVSLPKSTSYGACLFEGTTTYGVDFTKSHCSTVYTSATTIDLGTLVMHEYPSVSLEMMDAATWAMVPGGQMKLIAPDGTAKFASDGGALDLDGANNGMIQIRAKGPGKYTYCETIAPTGYWLTNPICGTVDLYWDMGIGIAVLHTKKATIFKIG